MNKFFSTPILRGIQLIRTRLSQSPVLTQDDFFFQPSDRPMHPFSTSNSHQQIDEAISAWRENPIARRIVALTTQYVVGQGLRISAEDSTVQSFLCSFWNHPLNRMERRIHEWSDELCKTGNLFLLISSDRSGMSYVRAIPSSRISQIEAQANDLEQPLFFLMKSEKEGTEIMCSERKIPSADLLTPSLDSAMLHFSVNRSLDSQWGMPDLAPMLKWISRYSNWLEDRARLNRYRNSFLFVVKSRLMSEAQRIARQRQLNLTPPTPGTILVSNENEEWSVLAPRLESSDANEDGLALKKMIAAGAGIPLHFLAEPESENKASAEASGSAAFRQFAQRQQFFTQMIHELLEHVCARAALVNPALNTVTRITVQGDDISSADNLRLSEAGKNITEVMETLRAAGFVEGDEMKRIVYRFIGEEFSKNVNLA